MRDVLAGSALLALALELRAQNPRTQATVRSISYAYFALVFKSPSDDCCLGDQDAADAHVKRSEKFAEECRFADHARAEVVRNTTPPSSHPFRDS